MSEMVEDEHPDELYFADTEQAMPRRWCYACEHYRLFDLTTKKMCLTCGSYRDDDFNPNPQQGKEIE
jgi:hypothetical protein